MRHPELNITSAMKRIRNKQHNETVIIQLEYTTRNSMLMDLMDYSYTKQNSRLREREQHEESFQFSLESLKAHLIIWRHQRHHYQTQTL